MEDLDRALGFDRPIKGTHPFLVDGLVLSDGDRMRLAASLARRAVPAIVA